MHVGLNGAQDEDLTPANRALALDRRTPGPLDPFGIAHFTFRFAHNAIALGWLHRLSLFARNVERFRGRSLTTSDRGMR